MDRPSTYRRIVVGVSGSLNSLVALQRAGAEARLTGRDVLAVLVWKESDASQAWNAPSAPERVRGARNAATRLLAGMLNDVFGGAAGDLRVHGLAVAGRPGHTLVEIACREDDLLVVGRGRGGRLRSPVAHHCLARAGCPVLTVPPSPLQLPVAALTRGRRLRAKALDDLAHELGGARAAERPSGADL